MRHFLFTLAVAFCVGSGVGSTSFAEEAVPSAVTVQTTGAGRYFTDTSGKTLYTYTLDKSPWKSACEGQCAVNWPPLEAPSDASPIGRWSIVMRSDGTKQWAKNGKPLYRYFRDTGPWAMLGDGLANSWYVAFEAIASPAEITIHESLLGRVLGDATGMTLYVNARDSKGKSNCSDKCLLGWQPLWSPTLATSSGDWSVVVRDDGRKQWAYKGQPLYSYRSELKPGSTVADGAGGIWKAVVVEPTPPAPSWITIQMSDLGPVLADASGRTLYIPQTEGPWNFEKMRKETCNDECLATYWRPVLLSANEPPPIGNWSTIVRDDGTKQLTYKGFGVFTFANDKKPGDVLRGEHFGSGLKTQSAGFRAILQSSMMRH
jgi:predicted lipoprotein with Yx(FWY)xxD motif